MVYVIEPNIPIMTESEAIIARHSVRQYLDKPIEAEKIEAIQECTTIATARAACISN